MNSPRKSTDCRRIPERHGSEDLARLHCLKALFPDWAGEDSFLLQQLKESIEASIHQQSHLADTFEIFSSMANSLRSEVPDPTAASHAFIHLDFTDKPWDPLFCRQEIVRELKRHAGMDHLFLLVRGLRDAVQPAAKYRTRALEAAYLDAKQFIDSLASHWATGSSKIHLLYL